MKKIILSISLALSTQASADVTSQAAAHPAAVAVRREIDDATLDVLTAYDDYESGELTLGEFLAVYRELTAVPDDELVKPFCDGSIVDDDCD